MSEDFAPRPLFRSIRKLAPLCREQWPELLRVALLGGASATLSALEPLSLKALFDRFVAKEGLIAALAPLGAFVAILTAREVCSLVQDRAFWRARLGISFGLLQAMIERLHLLPLDYHRDHGVGATMTKIERGMTGVTGAFSEFAQQLFPAIVYLAVSLVVMFRVDPRLSLVVLLFAPLPALIGVFASREQTQRESSLMQRWTRIFARFNEVLSGILVVKSFVMEEREKRRFLGGVNEANQIVLRGVATDSKFNTIRNGVIAVARIIALAIGGTLVMKGEIGVGTLVAFLAYLSGVFQPVQALTGIYQALRRATVSAESVLSILEAQVSLGDAPDARDAGSLRGDVEFKDVSFGYRRDKLLLQHVDFRARPGEVIALVGPSGAGKSTLMSLLQRLYAPTSGSVLLDGEDIGSFEQRSVRAQIGVVLQEGMLFSDSVRDNIAFGRPGATQGEIEAAARAANAHEFICKLEHGYDTAVGERGCKLSGGERQRIAIARALLKDAPILILDEATSALDSENEEKVQEALARLTKGRTTFVVAHRLATVMSADRILVLRDGTIVESGNHAQLMQAGGYYATLARKNFLPSSSGRSSRPPGPRSTPPRTLEGYVAQA
ncbi:MAG TPA: ABC transporter ATP-binding protein [Polyangiaceae bacterium]|nr:ABC transporter ATP-binding protein [Polyangiaceae bacterium]